MRAPSRIDYRSMSALAFPRQRGAARRALLIGTARFDTCRQPARRAGRHRRNSFRPDRSRGRCARKRRGARHGHCRRADQPEPSAARADGWLHDISRRAVLLSRPVPPSTNIRYIRFSRRRCHAVSGGWRATVGYYAIFIRLRFCTPLMIRRFPRVVVAAARARYYQHAPLFYRCGGDVTRRRRRLISCCKMAMPVSREDRRD